MADTENTQEKEVKEVKVKIDHTNPFNAGVTYESFLKAIGKKSIKEALKDTCTPEQIAWLETEIESFKNNK